MLCCQLLSYLSDLLISLVHFGGPVLLTTTEQPHELLRKSLFRFIHRPPHPGLMSLRVSRHGALRLVDPVANQIRLAVLELGHR